MANVRGYEGVTPPWTKVFDALSHASLKPLVPNKGAPQVRKKKNDGSTSTQTSQIHTPEYVRRRPEVYQAPPVTQSRCYTKKHTPYKNSSDLRLYACTAFFHLKLFQQGPEPVHHAVHPVVARCEGEEHLRFNRGIEGMVCEK